MKNTTPRQQEILDHIRQTLRQSGVPPTIAEIADALGLKSTNAVRGHLQALARKGLIELMPSLARGIRLLEYQAPADALPVIGRVAAGRPVLTEAHIEKYCRLDPELFQGKADYLLRVRGLSMRDAGILEGDLLAVQRTDQTRSGQIVIARIGDEVTVKRLRLEGSVAYLEPANPDFETLAVDLERQELCIEGVVVGVIRSEWV
ncbi:transcriptional repressor LexA [Methylocaldum sp. RMAD-M]|jgi:repressor LexA|uniref:transcriptional repressor LexA n=1 Tax=Methylocaldum sp. RMAD-M TaxID=2806557 RepID=UPI000A325208|nr:transcriptional repressor LexA [Methylocaldum sp. RMAD-M]MBP1148788.1 repressor LexA [Methylocaldum sp. RMAD-M]